MSTRPGMNLKVDGFGWRLTVYVGHEGVLIDTTRHDDLDDGKPSEAAPYGFTRTEET